MSQTKAAQLTLEVRRIRKSARAGFIDDYATCSPKTLAGLLTLTGGVKATDDDDAAENAAPVRGR